MSVRIGFQGLCAMVSERQDVAGSATFEALLVDSEAAKLECPHLPILTLPPDGVEDLSQLTKIDQDTGICTMDLTGKQLTFLPNGVRSAGTGFTTARLDLIPEMRQICNLSAVSSDCFATPPQSMPITARVRLPKGGMISGNADNILGEWSFVPPVSECYHGHFTREVLFNTPEADLVVVKVETLTGELLGELVLPNLATLTISNLCSQPGLDKLSTDDMVYFQLLDPPFTGKIPVAWPNGNCTESHDPKSPGLGCAPLLMSRG